MKHGSWVQGLFTIIAVSACTDSASTSTTPAVARFVASPQSSAELGVATWEVHIDGTDERVIGLDASSERQIEFSVVPDAATPDERVRFESVYPVAGSFELTKAGAIENVTSDAVRRLAVDVHADVGPNGAMIRDEVTATASASSIMDPRVSDSGTVNVNFDWFARNVTVVVGGACKLNTSHDHGEIYADYGSWSAWSFFLVPSDPTNCRSQFSMSVGGNHVDTFHWKILSTPNNLARGKYSFQSSTLNGASASLANDGNTDGNFGHGSVSHTNFEFRPFWGVDLGTTQALGGIVIFNRTDCCTDRLSDFQVFTSIDGSTWTSSASFVGTPTSPVERSLVGTSARYVAVQLDGSNFLSLAEVQIFPAL